MNSNALALQQQDKDHRPQPAEIRAGVDVSLSSASAVDDMTGHNLKPLIRKVCWEATAPCGRHRGSQVDFPKSQREPAAWWLTGFHRGHTGWPALPVTSGLSRPRSLHRSPFGEEFSGHIASLYRSTGKPRGAAALTASRGRHSGLPPSENNPSTLPWGYT